MVHGSTKVKTYKTKSYAGYRNMPHRKPKRIRKNKNKSIKYTYKYIFRLNVFSLYFILAIALGLIHIPWFIICLELIAGLLFSIECEVVG